MKINSQTKIISINLVKKLLKNKNIKLEGLFSLPWYLEWITRDIPKAKIFYATLDLNIILPIIFLKKNFINVAYMSSPPNLIYGNLDLNNLTFDILKEISSIINFHILIIRIHPHDNVSRVKLLSNKSYLLVEDKADLFINLKKSVADIYYNFEKRTRYTLRKALKLNDAEILKQFTNDPYLDGMIYEESNEKGLIDFSRLLKYQLAKIALESKRKNVKEFLGLQSYYSIENLKKTFEILGREGLLRLFFARGAHQEPEAGVALFVSKDYLSSPMAYWWLGASTYSAERKALPTILQFSIINILKNEGYKRYFLGGVGKDFRKVSTGPALFKRGFSKNFKQGYLLIFFEKIFFTNLYYILSNPKLLDFGKYLISFK
jgi:lipid II:glycine glycyltransferase (peptidoglycan interpeptide bridge formation enzyme)